MEVVYCEEKNDNIQSKAKSDYVSVERAFLMRCLISVLTEYNVSCYALSSYIRKYLLSSTFSVSLSQSGGGGGGGSFPF